MVAGLLVIASVKLSGVNHNLLFLSLLASIHMFLAATVTTRRRGALLVAITATLALFPREVPAPALVEVAPAHARRAFNAVVPSGQAWRYDFTLTDLAGHYARCGGLPGMVYVTGEGLAESTIAVRLVGTTWSAAPKFVKSNNLDQIQISPILPGVQKFSVILTATSGSTAAIRLGPETDGRQVFSDAVFLELKNRRCTILYETPRLVDDAPRAAPAP